MSSSVSAKHEVPSADDRATAAIETGWIANPLQLRFRQTQRSSD